MADLLPTPQAQARHEAELAAEREKNIVAYQEAAGPVLAELAAAGFEVKTIGELRRLGSRAKAAMPIIVKWLTLVSHDPLRVEILGVLSVRWAKAAAPFLIEGFQRAPSAPDGLSQYRWTIGNALAEAATDDVFADVVRLARDRRYGRDREMLAVALGRMRNPQAVDVLLDLLADDELAGHAVIALGTLKATRAAPALRRMRDHPKRWVRNEVGKALRKIGE